MNTKTTSATSTLPIQTTSSDTNDEMAKGKRGHEEVDTYEEDDFVENDDGAAVPKKKTKKAPAVKGNVKKDEDNSWRVRWNLWSLWNAQD